jgi:sugar-phosphatase
LLGTGLPLPRVLVTVEDVLRGKPDPEGFLSAARQLGMDPAACLVFEDAPAGLQAAAAAGMTAVAIVTGTAPGPAWVTVADHRWTSVALLGAELRVSIELTPARAVG